MAARRYSEQVEHEGTEYSFDFRTAGDRARFRDLWKEVSADLDSPLHEVINQLPRRRLISHALGLARQIRRLKKSQQ
jgi:hypothetical protein